MDQKQIQKTVLDVFKQCNIHCFPIDCFEIVKHYGYQIVMYDDLSEKKKAACLELSEDACIIKDTLYYNNTMPKRRVRFSIMHELGHLLLHSAEEPNANLFASYILAPRMVIHYADCKNNADVANLFLISLEAADYAFQDYRRWRRAAVYRMNELDRAIYNHFWNEECGKFVYSITYCYDCEELIYNQPGQHQCYRCSRRRMHYYKDIFEEELLPDHLCWHGAAYD